MSGEKDSLLKFPCQFPIKAMGVDENNFDAHVLEIVKRHAPGANRRVLTQRSSSNGQYLAVTVTIQATSREQLDSIYQDLTTSASVIMAL